MKFRDGFNRLVDYTKDEYEAFVKGLSTPKLTHCERIKDVIELENKRDACIGCRFLGGDKFWSAFHWACVIGYHIPNPDCEIYRGEAWRKQHGKELCELD